MLASLFFCFDFFFFFFSTFQFITVKLLLNEVSSVKGYKCCLADSTNKETASLACTGMLNRFKLGVIKYTTELCF